MSTITEIREAIARLPANEKSVMSAWLQSQEEPVMSETEEAALNSTRRRELFPGSTGCQPVGWKARPRPARAGLRYGGC